MSEVNKKYNRRISRTCPVCGGRVVVGNRNCDWWVYCEENRSHIPQRRFLYPNDAIYQWNLKANRLTNADRLRAMTDEELAEWSYENASCPSGRQYPECGVKATSKSIEDDCKQCWLDWLRQEAQDG